MSGGVDSAVAASLLLRAGHEVAGATMRLFCHARQDGPPRPCCDMEAVREARRSADALGIPHTVVDMEEVFRREVVDDFVSEYAHARTPNPCVRCNTFVKFGPLFEKAERMGYEAVATGHYVRRLRVTEGGEGLFRALDREKDQSYVLWGLPRSRIDRCYFPLGGIRKAVVRRLARRLGLAAWDRAESQDICFVPRGQHGGFVAERLTRDHPMRQPGKIRHIDGEELGEHEGLIGATIGQRRGFGVGGRGRLYVVRLEPESRTLWVGPKEATLSRGLIARDGNLLAPAEQVEIPGVIAKIRYRHEGVPCRVRMRDGDAWEVLFDRLEGAVAPGQSVALYAGDRLLGGARIEAPIPAEGGRPSG